jgi:hypothetical protein
MEFLGMIGGLWFILFVVAVFSGGLWASYTEEPFWAVATFAITIFISSAVFKFPSLSMILENPFLLVLFALVFVSCGALYTVLVKYPRYLREKSTTINDKYSVFLSKNKKDNTAESKEEFMDSPEYKQFMPMNNKARITNWMMMWPWGVSWDLLNRPIVWIYNESYNLIGK